MGRLRLVDLALDVALHGSRVLLHPVAVPGQDDDRDEDDGEADHVRTEVQQRPRQRGDEHPQGDAGEHAEQAAPCGVTIVPLGADLLEIGVDDAHDERGFEAFAERDDERAAHGLRGHSATMRPVACWLKSSRKE